MGRNLLSLFLFALCLFSCTSIRSYNEHITKEIPAEKLKEDVDYIQKKLYKMQPDLDWYISMEELDFKFDSLRKTISKAAKPNDFYLKLAPLIGEVRQGHTSVSPLSYKPNKEDKRRLKDSKGPFYQLDFYWDKDRLLLIKDSSKDKNTPTPSKVVSINGIRPENIYQKYAKTEHSDGFNQTYIDYKIDKKFAYYYSLEIGYQDSLELVLDYEGELFNKKVYRAFKPQEKNKTQTNTPENVIKQKKESLSRRDLRIKHNRFGYNKLTKSFAKDLSFPTADSTIALLKIRNFSKGAFRKAYADIFQSIKDHKVDNLILDLRDNGGGYITDARALFSYFADSSFYFVSPAKVQSKTTLGQNVFKNNSPLKQVLLLPGHLIYSLYTYFATYKAKDGNYYFRVPTSGKSKPKKNAYKGKLYILINGGSFSATSLVASHLKANQKGIFVGQETGGAYNGTVAGQMPKYILPNSKLQVSLGLLTIKPTQQSDIEGRGILPDIEIIPTLEDKMKAKDPELNWVLKKIDKEGLVYPLDSTLILHSVD